MKRKIFKIILLSFITLISFNISHATLNLEKAVDVPESCTVTDTSGTTHNYPQTNSPSSYLAICALDTSIKNGSISGAQFSNEFPSMGLFITTLNDIAADPSNQYWAIYQNGSFANAGIASLPVSKGDVLKFQLNDFSDNNSGNYITLNINSLVTKPTSSSGGPLVTEPNPIVSPIETSIPAPTNTIEIKKTFDTKKAFDFLISQQKENGSFGEDIYTDWAALSIATGNYQNQIIKLIKYLGEYKLENPSLTDYERRAMALSSLGLNPYNWNNENYIEKIITSFDGKQFGNKDEDNDDIFALIVLQNTGYDQTDKIIRDDISFILSKQKENGSWDNSVDMTGAGIQAITFLNQNEEIKNALIKAKEFLKQSQKDNGGWNDNASSTAWVIGGILALNEKPEDWIKNNNTPLVYLTSLQDEDGGIKNENIQNKIWETIYVVSSLSNKTWNQIMQKFEKPKIQISTENPKKFAKKIKSVKLNASAINANTPPTNFTQIEITEKSWLVKFLDKIFNIF